jgi:hypothetical protein
MNGDKMEQYQKILALGMGIMIFAFIFPFIVITIGGPLHETPPSILFILLITGFAIVIYGWYKWFIYREQGHAIKDERTQKIWDKSRSYTLYVTIPFIMILISFYRLQNLELNYSIVWLVILQIAITQIIFRWYLNKKKNL